MDFMRLLKFVIHVILAAKLVQEQPQIVQVVIQRWDTYLITNAYVEKDSSIMEEFVINVMSLVVLALPPQRTV